MTHRRVSATQLLAADLQEAEFTERPWVVHWDEESAPVERLVLEGLPAESSFFTSGSTGQHRRWQRTSEQLWDEACMVAGMIERDRPEAVLAFAPPRHLYGMIASVLVPARLGVPVWYMPAGAPLPPAEGRRWVVMAIPWAFRILLQRVSWFERTAGADFVHSTASLPATAFEMLDTLAACGRDGSLLELFGSTETGAVATRRWRAGEAADPAAPWTLCPDVRFGSSGTEEVPLSVQSPRLAREDESNPMHCWEMDDRVRITGERTFAFAGRRTRLVNVNGRRLDLDHLEEVLRSAVDCADAACVPVADPLTGEHFDVLLVPGDEGPPTDSDLLSALDLFPCRPRRVLCVARINRSETGKLRHLQPEAETILRGGQ